MMCADKAEERIHQNQFHNRAAWLLAHISYWVDWRATDRTVWIGHLRLAASLRKAPGRVHTENQDSMTVLIEVIQ
jgi:hypothetical protein